MYPPANGQGPAHVVRVGGGLEVAVLRAPSERGAGRHRCGRRLHAHHGLDRPPVGVSSVCVVNLLSRRAGRLDRSFFVQTHQRRRPSLVLVAAAAPSAAPSTSSAASAAAILLRIIVPGRDVVCMDWGEVSSIKKLDRSTEKGADEAFEHGPEETAQQRLPAPPAARMLAQNTTESTLGKINRCSWKQMSLKAPREQARACQTKMKGEAKSRSIDAERIDFCNRRLAVVVVVVRRPIHTI